MRSQVLGVALVAALVSASRFHSKRDGLDAAAEDSSSNEDTVGELRQQLQESQQEDDTNEAIIESLLAKQGKLANASQELQKDLDAEKHKSEALSHASPVEVTSMKKQIGMLQTQVAELTTKLSTEESKEAGESKDLASEKARDVQLEKRNKELLSEATKKVQEGRALRQSLTRTKLALLQSMNEGSLKRTTDSSDNSGGSVVSASSNIRALSEKLFAESSAMQGQVTTLSKKLASETHLEREEKAQIQQLEAQNSKLHEKVRDRTDHTAALEDSYAKVDSMLAQTLHELRREEKGLRDVTKQKAEAEKAAAVQQAGLEAQQQKEIEALKAANAQLKAAGSEVMQKYDMLGRAYQQQQRLLRQQGVQVVSGGQKAPRVFLERSSRLQQHWHGNMRQPRAPWMPRRRVSSRSTRHSLLLAAKATQHHVISVGSASHDKVVASPRKAASQIATKTSTTAKFTVAKSATKASVAAKAPAVTKAPLAPKPSKVTMTERSAKPSKVVQGPAGHNQHHAKTAALATKAHPGKPGARHGKSKVDKNRKVSSAMHNH